MVEPTWNFTDQGRKAHLWESAGAAGGRMFSSCGLVEIRDRLTRAPDDAPKCKKCVKNSGAS